MSGQGWLRSLIQSLVLLFTLFSVVKSQSFTPAVVSQSASTYQEGGKKLYVFGGLANPFDTVNLPQAFSIDLSSSWDTNEVPYEKLSDVATDGALISAISKDGQSILALGGKTTRQYSVEKKTWAAITLQLPLSISQMTLLHGGITDPKTGLVYFAYRTPTVAQPVIVECNLDNHTSRALPKISDSESWGNAMLVWSSTLNKLVLFGFAANDINSEAFQNAYVYDTTAGWNKLPAKGTIPNSRTGGCLASAYSGTMLVLFGGNMGTAAYLSDIFFLDLTTMTWTQGSNAGMGGPRTGAACAISDDYFVAWGGTNINGIVKTNTTLVFNIRTRDWRSRFTANSSQGWDVPTTQISLPTGKPTSTGDTGSNIDLGLVVGASVGTFAVVIVAGGLFIFFRHRKLLRMTEMDEHGGSSGKDGSGSKGKSGNRLRTVQGPPPRGPQGPAPRNPQNNHSSNQLQAADMVEDGVLWEEDVAARATRNPQDPSSLQGQNYGFNYYMEMAPRDPQYVRGSQEIGYSEQMSYMRAEVPIPIHNPSSGVGENQTLNYNSEAMYSDSGYGRSGTQEISQNISYFGDLSGSVCVYNEADTSNDFERVMRNRYVLGANSNDVYRPLLVTDRQSPDSESSGQLSPEPQYPIPPHFYDNYQYPKGQNAIPYQGDPNAVPRSKLHG